MREAGPGKSTTERASIWRLLGRCLRRRCPVCGVGPLFRGYFTVRDGCPVCGFSYVRDNEYGHEGYFTGAMALNLVVTGVVPLVVLFTLAITTPLPVMLLTVIGVAWTITFPILFYPYSCALWIAIDHVLNPPTAAELAASARAQAETPSPLAAMRRGTRPRS